MITRCILLPIVYMHSALNLIEWEAALQEYGVHHLCSSCYDRLICHVIISRWFSEDQMLIEFFGLKQFVASLGLELPSVWA